MSFSVLRQPSPVYFGAPGESPSLAPGANAGAVRYAQAACTPPGCQFPWFDDNVAGVLAPRASRFRQLRYDTWEQFRWDVALEKAAVNFWGSQRNLEPVVGFEIRLSEQGLGFRV